MSSEDYTCEICQKVYKTFDDLASHVHTNRCLLEYECFFCPYFCQTGEELQEHIELFHPDPSASVQAEPETNVAYLSNGAASSSNGTAYSCYFCHYSTTDTAELEAHVKSHFDIKPQLNPREELQEHIELCHPDPSASVQSEPKFNVASSSNGAASSSNGAASSCPMAMCYYSTTDTAELEAHVNSHFDIKPQLNPSSLSLSNGHDKSNKISNPAKYKFSPEPKRQRTMNIPAPWKDELRSYTQDVVKTLRTYYNSRKQFYCRLHLSLNCGHFSTQKMPDSGYGCGYRNLQMILSSLSEVPLFQSSLFENETFIPSVYRLQMLLEEAWKNGFDDQGCQQLRGKVINTKKWIGATEVATILSYLRIKCQIYDFCQKSSGPVAHPKLIECVRSYYESNNDLKPPLYLQHEGHSRVIVGMEEKDGRSCLLVLDPGMPKYRVENIIRSMNSLRFKDDLLTPFLKSLHTFDKDKYQIVAVIGQMKNDYEWEKSKAVTSLKMS